MRCPECGGEGECVTRDRGPRAYGVEAAGLKNA